MMFSGQFDGISGFSQPTQSSFSPASNRDTHGVVPVTVKQISEASQSGDDKSNFVVSGVDVANVTVVGMVSNMVEKVTDVGFRLDDGTGMIDCKRWLNEQFDKKQMEKIQDGMYVRACGHLGSFRGERSLVTFSVSPVTNFDEISFHFIECIHFHLRSSKLQLQGDATSKSDMVNSSPTTPIQNRTNVYNSALPSQLSAHFNGDAVKGFNGMVLDYLRLPSNYDREMGVHTDELSQKLKLPVEKTMESIKFLEDEGLIYSTIDEYHYKATSSS